MVITLGIAKGRRLTALVVRVYKVENFLGVVLPKDILTRLVVKECGKVFFNENDQ